MSDILATLIEDLGTQRIVFAGLLAAALRVEQENGVDREYAVAATAMHAIEHAGAMLAASACEEDRQGEFSWRLRQRLKAVVLEELDALDAPQ